MTLLFFGEVLSSADDMPYIFDRLGVLKEDARTQEATLTLPPPSDPPALFAFFRLPTDTQSKNTKMLS